MEVGRGTSLTSFGEQGAMAPDSQHPATSRLQGELSGTREWVSTPQMCASFKLPGDAGGTQTTQGGRRTLYPH